MVKIKKKEKAAVYKSALVVKSVYSEICKRSIILGILAIFNLLSSVLNVFHIKFTSAIFIAIFLDLCRLCTLVKEENIVTIRGMGFQMTTKYLLGAKTVFIPQEQVQNVFINEVIFRNRVIYVLSLSTKDTRVQEKLIPLFFGTLPRLANLKVMYKHLKTLQD